MIGRMMRAVSVVGKEEFRFEQLPVPLVGSGEVLIKVAYCGICGSDVPRYFEGAVHAFPQVLGHEFSGTVVAASDDARGIHVGDRVAVAPHIPCGSCEQCQAKNPTLCLNYSFIGSREQGAMAEYVVAPAANIVPVGGLDLRVAALVEPQTVALHAVGKVKIDPGWPVAVLGSGVIGLMTVLSLRSRGVKDITVVDINPWVLDVAARVGASRTVNALSGDDDVVRTFDDSPPAVVFETAGAGATIKQALQIAARKGTVVYVGKPIRPIKLDVDTFETILRKELTIHGSWLSYSWPFPGHEWSDAVELLSKVPIRPTELITHEYELDDAAAGFRAMRDSGEHRLKVMFRIGDSI